MLNFHEYYTELGERLRDASIPDLQAVCSQVLATRQRGRKVIVAGNGGSAAIASHVAVDLTKAAKIRAVCFNEADLITCLANDYGYEHWLARAIEFYGDEGDLVILVSSSGRSPNILNAALQAQKSDLTVVTLSGFDAGNPLRSAGTHNLWVNSRSYNVVELVHQTWLLACVDYVVAAQEAYA